MSNHTDSLSGDAAMSVRRLEFGLLVGASLLTVGCEAPGAVIIDDWGPPAGYAVGQLPPSGALPAGIADTLRLNCSVFLDRTGVVRDSVVVSFGRTLESAPANVINPVWP